MSSSVFPFVSGRKKIAKTIVHRTQMAKIQKVQAPPIADSTGTKNRVLKNTRVQLKVAANG
jgi:hypothetical protein